MSGLREKIGSPAAVVALVRRYAVAALLLAWCLWAIGGYLLAGDRAVPLSPPDGYVAEEGRVLLTWSEGGGVEEQAVEVAEGEDFSKTVFSKTVKGASVSLPRLAPGARYCWRLESNPGYVSCFTTGPVPVDY
jgi:hypothetical protein